MTATFDRKAEEAPSPPAAEEGAAKASSSAWYKGGKALLKIRCNGAGACKGKLTLEAKVKQGKKIRTVVIGKSSFDVAAGKSRTVRVKITNGQVKKLLNSGKTLIVKLSGKGVKSRTIKLKPSKVKHKGHKKHHERS